MVINKFYELEGRVNCIMDILGGIQIENPEILSKESLNIVENIKNRQLISEN